MTQNTTPATKLPRKMAREPQATKPARDTSTPKSSRVERVKTIERSRTATPQLTLEKPPSKTSQVLALLQRPDGASLNELIEATSWLPHTTRAALTGLKKKGHVIASVKVDDVQRYRVAGPAA